jgi:hypothetical protein
VQIQINEFGSHEIGVGVPLEKFNPATQDELRRKI